MGEFEVAIGGRIKSGTEGYVLSHAGSNLVFDSGADDQEKTLDTQGVIPVFQREWSLVKPVLLKLLDSNA